MLHRAARHVCAASVLLVLACAMGSGCAGGGGFFKHEYEYEEELYLSLDGSATLNVHASIASLVALHGANFNPDPRARIDRNDLRAFFGAPDARVSVSLSRRDGRRFAHASIEVDDVQELSRLRPCAWSNYHVDRRGDVIEFRQTVGPSSHGGHGRGDWTGEELVAFRMHLPSEIVFHNAPSGRIERGNILEWNQRFAERLDGTPLELRVQFGTTSILAHTMLLFGSAMAAAIATLAGAVWWMSRRGREA
jgi:hypothetical protein